MLSSPFLIRQQGGRAPHAIAPRWLSGLQTPVPQGQVPNDSIRCDNVLFDTQERLEPGQASPSMGEALRLSVGGNWDRQQVTRPRWSEGTRERHWREGRACPTPCLWGHVHIWDLGSPCGL